MGGPELPTDPGDEQHFPTPIIEHPHIADQSEDSDDADAYDGYQPLAMDVDDAGTEETAEADEDIDLLAAPVTHGDPNMPAIESADVEIERQVWNEPRPQELQLELDKARTEQILNVMSKITLPNITVPDWAQGVPEERWKHELLERIQTRKEPTGAGAKGSASDAAGGHSKST